ncbi:MAG: DinB family protein [Winogradskyella sp.]|nr:DinB family protein [Winogradskyella sp.]
MDTERVFVYRAMRIARQDKTEMVGFEQDDYVDAGKANNRTINSLIEEYKAVRNATIVLFDSFSDEELKSIGKANGSPVSVRAIGYIITGHENHHNNVIRERYL